MAEAVGVPVLVLMCLLSLLGGCGAGGSRPAAAAAGTESSDAALPARLIEIAVVTPADDAKADSLAAAAAGLRGLRKAQSGFVSSEAARTAQGAILEVTVWGDLRQAEAANLAAAGTKEGGDFKAAAGGGAQTTFFRELRSHRYAGATAEHLEVVVFRTKAGVTREQHLAAFDAAEADFASSGGLAGHDLGIAPDGRWVHVVYWKSSAAFDTVGKGLMKQPGIAGWFKTLDYRQFSMQRGDVVPAPAKATPERPSAGK